jgi:hypothetical protein
MNPAQEVCFKLIVKLTRGLEAQGVLATYPYLREQSGKQAPSTIPHFEHCFRQALKDELIFDIKGLYSTKRPGGIRDLDDGWQS